jgi:AsmA-like C-terminal region
VSSGSVQGNFAVREDGASRRGPEFQGRGEITNLRLQSASNKVDLSPGSIPFVLSSVHASALARLKGKSVRPMDAEVLPAPDELHVAYGPFPVALGRPVPAQARGWVARSGYGMVIRGDGEVSHSLRVASLLGLPAVKASVEGMAQMDLQIAGSWAGNVSGSSSGFSMPEVTGTVQLRNVRTTVRGVNGPIEISSAELQLAPDGTRVEKLSARAADARWTGTVALPRGCGAPGACVIRFNLNTEDVGLGDLDEWLGSRPIQRRWYQLLRSAEPKAPSFLQNLRASGKVSAERLLMHNLVAHRVSASLDLEGGKLKIAELRADLLGGKHRGDWQMDFSEGSPVYTGAGTLSAISLQQIAEAMHDPWISGTAGGTYQLTASGADSAAFWRSADGGVQFDLRDGVLSHIFLTNDEGPLRVERWQGRARLNGGRIEIEKGKLVSPAGVYEINGTASLGRVLDLKLTQATEMKPAGAGSLVYSVTGTLAEPRVALAPTPETQARLKP